MGPAFAVPFLPSLRPSPRRRSSCARPRPKWRNCAAPTPPDSSPAPPTEAKADAVSPGEAPTPAPPEAPVPAEAAPVYETPSVGEAGYINMYEGTLDAIDASNFTFGGFNKLTERDTYLGKKVVVNNVGKEGPVEIFYREVVPDFNYDPEEAVLLLSGLPASSYSYREVLPVLAKEVRTRAIAMDWVGFGFSEKCSPGYGFGYTPEEYLASIDEFLKAAGVKKVKAVVVQGWLGVLGLVWALRGVVDVGGVYVLNAPLPGGDGRGPKMPFKLSKWGLPGMMGDAFAQDSLSVEQAIQSGGRYSLAISDCEVYRRPQMLSGDAGFSLAAATKRLGMKDVWAEIISGMEDWDKPIAIGWGVDDKYLSVAVAEKFVKEVCPRAELRKIEGAGHYAQEDFGERVAEGIVKFVRSMPEA